MKKEYLVYAVIVVVTLMAASKIRASVPFASKIPEL